MRAKPEAMSTSIDDWCESLLYVAGRAWAQKTGRDESEWDCETSVSFESFSNTAQW